MSPAHAFTLISINSLFAALALAASNAFALPAPVDADLQSAKEAAQKGNLKALEGWKARFAGHLLEAYPAYWLLSASLDKADPAEVRAFLARYGDGPLAESLRRDWLKTLGASGSWETFRREFSASTQDDPEVTCFALQERLARSDAEALREARALWLAGRESPAACAPVFDAALAAGRIGAPETWERLRKLLAAGALKDAKRANAALPANERIAEKALDHASRDPAGYLRHENGRVPGRAAREAALFAIGRLARIKPEDAAREMTLLAKTLDAQDTRYGWGQVAIQGAMVHHPQALAWYREAGEGPFTDAQLAWKARAGMRAGDWDAVRTAVNLMSREEAREPAWRYWLARALTERGARDAADALFVPLAREANFYGLLAAEETNSATKPDWTGWQPGEEDLQKARAVPAVQRALALYRADLREEGLREWLFAIRGLDDRALLAAAHVAAEAGIPDRAIGTADRTVQLHDFAQRYPTPHREMLGAAARQWNVDEALLYGIIRQESRFIADVRSRVGATGLMQLMPATARWVAKQIPVTPFKPSMLTQVDVNLQMGAYYFRRVLTDLGDPVLATAAYNAGPGRAKRWRDARPLEGAIYAESIPFPETRDYVKKVAANTWYYTSRLTGKTASLKQLLGTVPGRSAGDSDAVVAIP